MMRLLTSFDKGKQQILSRWSSSGSSSHQSSIKRVYSNSSLSHCQYTLFNPSVTSDAEHPAKRHKHRAKSTYSENYTAALKLPCSPEELETLSNKKLFCESKKFIIEHAARRVDLFFYTVIAYYKTAALPTQGHTHLQHGRGRTLLNHQNVTQACHSSFFTSLVDKSGSEKMKEAECILSGTHFMDSLNSTVELPPYVNELDNELENHFSCRKKALEILCEVDKGKIDPVEGLRRFLIMMNKVISEIEADVSKVEKLYLKYKELTPKLISLIKRGTLAGKFSTETNTPNDDYVELLLRLSPEEKAACRINAKARNQIYNEKMREIQTEIMSTKSVCALSK